MSKLSANDKKYLLKEDEIKSELLNALFDEYLNILEIQRQEPSLENLNALVKSHLIHIPFENVSKLYYRVIDETKKIPNLDQYLEGIKKYNFGGTCYANNYYFYLLLNNLGYQIKLCGADMESSEPNAHMVSIVKLENREFLVDVGYGAPFFNPIPRDLKSDYIIKFGCERYVLKPQNENGNSKLEFYRDAELVHGYLAKPAPLGISSFEKNIRDSFLDDALFMNSLSFSKFKNEGVIAIRNFEVSNSSRTSTVTNRLKNYKEVRDVVLNEFGIPAPIIDIILEKLDYLKNVKKII
jgi:arylamine N-acetyltransferase